MEAVVLVEWLKQPGASLADGETVAIVETAKATTEIESPIDGILAEVLVNVGDEIEVGAVIGRVSSDFELPNQAATQDESPSEVLSETESGTEQAETPISNQSKNERVVASPLARRIANELKVDLHSIKGTGPKGRIRRKDVELAHEGLKSEQEISKEVVPQALEPAIKPVDYPLETVNFEIRPHDNMRKTIARRLVEAKATIPHFYLKATCNIDSLLELRTELNAKASLDSEGQHNYKISINDFILKAHALALATVPDANVTWTDEGMLVHNTVDIAVAIAIPGGLVTPVMRMVESKSLSAISDTVKDFSTRAHNRQLAAEEYQGGTSTVSNLGMYGVDEFSAIINPPHATILAVGASRQEAEVIFDAVSTSTKMTVTLSVDHRAVDGALGAELLQAFKENIENPLRLLV